MKTIKSLGKTAAAMFERGVQAGKIKALEVALANSSDKFWKSYYQCKELIETKARLTLLCNDRGELISKLKAEVQALKEEISRMKELNQTLSPAGREVVEYREYEDGHLAHQDDWLDEPDEDYRKGVKYVSHFIDECLLGTIESEARLFSEPDDSPTIEEMVKEIKEAHPNGAESPEQAEYLGEVEQRLGECLNEAPVRLCCGQRHYGPVCNDEKVMCCLCFNRVPKDQLHLLENGKREDVCEKCHSIEKDIVPEGVGTAMPTEECPYEGEEALKRVSRDITDKADEAMTPKSESTTHSRLVNKAAIESENCPVCDREGWTEGKECPACQITSESESTTHSRLVKEIIDNPETVIIKPLMNPWDEGQSPVIEATDDDLQSWLQLYMMRDKLPQTPTSHLQVLNLGIQATRHYILRNELLTDEEMNEQLEVANRKLKSVQDEWSSLLDGIYTIHHEDDTTELNILDIEQILTSKMGDIAMVILTHNGPPVIIPFNTYVEASKATVNHRLTLELICKDEKLMKWLEYDREMKEKMEEKGFKPQDVVVGKRTLTGELKAFAIECIESAKNGYQAEGAKSPTDDSEKG